MQDGDELSVRLRRVAGQVQVLEGLVQDGRYCVDILTQSAAVRRALQEVELTVLRHHLRTCMPRATKSGSPAERDRTVMAQIDRRRSPHPGPKRRWSRRDSFSSLP